MLIPDISHFALGHWEISLWTPLGRVNLLLLHFFLWLTLRRAGCTTRQSLFLLLSWCIGLAVGTVLLPSVLGAILGAFLGFEATRRLLGFQYAFGPHFARLLAGFIFIGRIGCLLTGCCFGSPCSLPWGIQYSAYAPATIFHHVMGWIPDEASHSLSVHPVQAYEMLFLAIAFFCIPPLAKRLRNPNAIFFWFVAAYLLQRFGIEFIRDMTNVWWGVLSWGPFTRLQWFLLGGSCVLTAAGIFVSRKEISRPHLTTDMLLSPLQQAGLLGIGYLSLLFIHNRLTLVVELLALAVVALTTLRVVPDILHQLFTRWAWSDFSIRWIPAPASMALLLLCSLPFIPRAFAEWGDTTTTESDSASINLTPKTVFYEVDTLHQKLVRTGDESTPDSVIEERRGMIGLSRSPSLSTMQSPVRPEPLPLETLAVEEPAPIPRKSWERFGVHLEGMHVYQDNNDGCSGPSRIYHQQIEGGSVHYERESSEKYYSYYRYGASLALWRFDWTGEDYSYGVTNHNVSGTQTLLAGSVNGAIEMKYAGMGLSLPVYWPLYRQSVGSHPFSSLGISPLWNDPNFAPFYLRLGHPYFSVRAGLDFLELQSRGENMEFAAGIERLVEMQRPANAYIRMGIRMNQWYINPQIGLNPNEGDWHAAMTVTYTRPLPSR